MKSSYEVEREFQAQQAAHEILDNLNIQCSGSSPSKSNRSYPNSQTGSITNERELGVPAPHAVTPVSNPESYLYIPTTAGNLLTDRDVQPKRTAARRLFSVCCIFDVLFITIMWAICSIAKYGSVLTAFNKDFKHYSFKNSMADIMWLSMVRVAFLLIHYWVINSKLQITIILTTLCSTVYVFVKLFYYRDQDDGDKDNEDDIFTYFILLSSFIICWVEVWLFETKVLKAENQVTRILRPGVFAPDDMRQPLLSNYHGASSDFNYSQFQTPAATIPPTPGGYAAITDEQEVTKLDPRGQSLHAVASQAHNELHEMVVWPDGWTTEVDLKDGIKVFSRAQRKAPNRLFLSECHYQCELEDLFEVLYTQSQDIPSWNTQILEFSVIEQLTSHLDIVYSVGTSGGGGLIKSRGMNGPCGYVFFPDLDGSIKLTYVVNVDLKIPFVPQKVINSALNDVIHDFHLALRTRVDNYVVNKHRQGG